MDQSVSHPLLQHIDSPADLKTLSESELVQLAQELRSYLLHTIAGSGGHLGAGLGVVELTVALHYLYNTPDDRIVWDVGHQSYPHKILTGRRERLGTIRKHNGLAPFPSRDESGFDTFGVGHAGTSISAAIGMALAARQQGLDRKCVAVIGDGAMTAGLAYEALDHGGDLDVDLLVILNDNEMSISPNVGALTNYLARCVSGGAFQRLREGGKRVLNLMPPMREFARRAEDGVKNFVTPGGLFTSLGFDYYGPVNGHDLPALIHTIRNLRALSGPRLLHVVTTKGKGYARAEADRVAYHGVPKFDLDEGIAPSAKGRPTYSKIFGDWLCDMAARDERLVGITPAMREGSGLTAFAKRYPKRYFDVAIAEQHSVTLAAGMACDGLKPVVAIYSTFLQRAYDQVIHDVALQNLPVLFAVDRGGVVGADGATHQGAFDYSYLRCVPNMIVMAPADENECRQMLFTGFITDQPCSVRYPRGTGPGVPVEEQMHALEIGRAEVRREGRDIALLAFGATVAAAEEAGRELNATVVNMRFVKPLDEALLMDMARRHPLLVTIEDQVIAGGAGSAVSECFAHHGVQATVRHLGLPDAFVEHGSRDEQLSLAGLDAAGILRSVRALRAASSPTSGRAEAKARKGNGVAHRPRDREADVHSRPRP